MRISDWSPDVCSSDHPVIIGVGQINDRPDDPDRGLDSLGLMVAALKAADADAGGGLLTDLDSLAIVDQISFRSEEHTSELQSLMRISYAVFCLKKKKSIPYNYINNKI